MSFRILRPLVAYGALCLAQVAFAQTKVGVISLQKALSDTAEIKKAEQDLQATLVKPKQAEADKLNAEIAAITQKLQTEGDKLSPQAQFDLNAQGRQAQVQLQRLNEDLQAQGTEMRNEILAKSSDRMQAVVKKLAEEKGLDLVVDTQVALFFKPALDLTVEATAAYDKTYPVGSAPAAPPKK